MQQQTLFRFDPNLSDAPLPRGRYDARITDAQQRVSKAGNEMLELTLRTATPEGHVVVLRDYLVSTPRAKWKIKQFCKAAGMDYARGEIGADEVIGKDVAVEVNVEEGREGRDRNVVTDYLPLSGAEVDNGEGRKSEIRHADRVWVGDGDEGGEIPF